MSTLAGDTHLRAFALTALLLLLLGAAVIGIADRFLADARAIAAAQELLTGLSQVGRAEREAIAVQRAYLLTGDAEQRERFQQSIARVAGASEALGRLIPGAVIGATRFADLQQALDARLERARLEVATNDRDGAQAAQALLRDGTGASLDRDIRDSLERLTTAGSAQLQTAMASAERSSFWLLLCAALGAPIALLALGLGYLALRREVHSRQAAESANEAARLKLQESVEQLTQMSGDMQRLSAYAGLLQTCDTTEEVLDVTRVCFAALFPGYAGMVYLISDDRAQAVAATEWGLTRLVSADRIQPSQCWAWRRAQPYVTGSDNADLRCTHLSGAATATSTVCLPLNAHGVPFGLLYMDGPEPLRNERLAATAAEQLSLALANLKLRESLRDQSIRDALTGLYNRRHLEQTLQNEFARCRASGRPLAVMMIDVDHFKAFNDQHGHAAGDAVLGVIGRLLGERFRARHIPCRYGGEEFTVILPETDVDAALALAESTRLAIAELSIEDDGRPLPQVTASIGVATIPGSVDGLDELIESADRALYVAKSRGRNQVVVGSQARGSREHSNP
jgi:diguanylate cyclase (GGDEF)-like protein